MNNLAEHQKIVPKAIFDDPIDRAKQFDTLFATQDSKFIEAMVISRSKLCDFRSQIKDDQQKIAAALLLLKAQNDILAGFHLLRSGYNTRVIYFFRLTCESICQSILIFSGVDYYENFKEDKTKAHRSIDSIKQKLPLVGLPESCNDYLKWLCENKSKMNLHSHSTVDASIGDLVKLEPTFGPSFDSGKIDDYKAYEVELSELSTLVGELANWMKNTNI
ncbi:hypothetical protein PDESU_03101 [Pontiella desulfatans]|uniref:HEPN domain-containing protein n=1 Tax=Pontiella desulfatans TaxID=2750659 RepID=A0A6C2U3E6_PONDE|nr:hypothetical protein [Pontiella desulfatans]VGO14538.1 hypothetical protein PDESU_03101 [Pontiella desulfatans]